MTKDEALKLALEALEQLQGGCTDHDDGTVEAITVWCPEVIEAIEAALAQPEQERQWVGLTDVERDDLVAAGYDRTTINTVNILLKGKNT